MRSALFYLLLSFLSISNALSQSNTIYGQLLDKDSKKPLASITVLLKGQDHKIIGFKASDSNGNFSLSTQKDIKYAYIEVNHLGYKKKRVEDIKLDYKNIIELEINPILLEDIKVKSRPRIQRSGDTLAYNVASFAKEEDRSIADVLKRMPGIEVSESGQLKYQGKHISNFYIDGDDLLGDKYAIGTKTVAHKMVRDVQVLNNHEHMKVLKNKRNSDEVAINLVINDEAKLSLSGQVKLGAGLPKQYDLETNTVLFNKKYKGLNVIQGNNTGRSLKSDLIGFNAASLLSKLGRKPINNILSLGTVGPPPIEEYLYLKNNFAGLNANNLFNLKDSWQIKSNIQAIFEKSNQQFNGNTTYLTEGVEYRISEDQHTKTNTTGSTLSLTASKNLDKLYLNNDLSLEYERENGTATIRTTEDLFNVKRNYNTKGFRNKLVYVPALKNGDIIELSWITNYGSKPQELTVYPGVFAKQLNQSLPYDYSFQQVAVPSLFSDLSLGYRLAKGFVSQAYTANLSLDDQKLSSDMSIGDQGAIISINNPENQNDMHWQRSSLGVTANYQYNIGRLSSGIALPLSYQHTRYSDPHFNLNVRNNKIRFTPSLSAKYNLSLEQEIAFNYNRGIGFGNIEDVYRGLVIRNYRTLSSNTADINESRSDDFTVNYKTGKTLNLLFYNLGAKYSNTKSSTLLSNHIDDNSSQIKLIAQENTVKNYTINMGIDKYIFGLSSTIKIHTSVNWTDYNQLFNDELLPFQNVSYTLSPSIEARVWRKINVSYSGNLDWLKTKQQQVGTLNLDRNAFNFKQSIGFPVTLFSGFHWRATARHLFSHQQDLKNINYLFLDSFIRYNYKRWRTDFELNISNIGNIKRFELYNVSANMQSQNTYELRGRMAIMKVVFNFK